MDMVILNAKSKKAYDFLIQAESGLCSVTGTQKVILQK